MLSFLFPRLTPAPSRGSALFDALVGEARQPHWYSQGQVPNTIDGRFAVLATLVALVTVRLERGGEPATRASVALAERFVESMDAEHRQLGLGDPALGKTVRKLVGALGRRVELWRQALERGDGWNEAVTDSLFHKTSPPVEALDHCRDALSGIWARLKASADAAVAEGRFG